MSVTLSINENKIGDHPLICRFMKGLRNLRPPIPEYPVAWNAKDLLTYLKDWKVDVASPLREITTKLATLLTCLSVQRVHTISLIDSRNIRFDHEATYLYLFEDLKVQRNLSLLCRPYMKATHSKLLSCYVSIWTEQQHFVVLMHRTVSQTVYFSATSRRIGL